MTAEEAKEIAINSEIRIKENLNEIIKIIKSAAELGKFQVWVSQGDYGISKSVEDSITKLGYKIQNKNNNQILITWE